ncbi:MAG: hypothetical protein HQ510_12125 [Candidatus Marinimicrobia bacterium]|nr:hypothetical protein [Candidatus Neomarinimicrobiota bacterium]
MLYKNENIIRIILLSIGAILGTALMLIFGNTNITLPVTAIVGMIFGSTLTFIFNRFLSRQSFKQQLLLTNISTKLNAHQQAFSIWWDIRSNINQGEKIYEIVVKAHDWWQNNCLYLYPKSRKAFYNCLLFATSHRDLMIVQNPNYDYRKDIKESWDTIIAPGLIIPEEVELESFEDQDQLFKFKSPSV